MQDGGTSGADGLPGPFTDVGSTPASQFISNTAVASAPPATVASGVSVAGLAQARLGYGLGSPYANFNTGNTSINDIKVPDLLTIPLAFSGVSGWQQTPIDVLNNPYWNPLAANVSTGLGAGVDGLVAESPTLTAEIQYLKASGWSIGWGDASQASNTTYSSRGDSIVISQTYQRDVASVVSQLAHEVGHALSLPTLSDWLLPLTSNAASDEGYSYASTNTSVELVGEGFATLNNVAIQQEILTNTGGIQPDTGVNIRVASANATINVPQYQSIFNDYVNGEDAFTAATQIGGIYRNNEIPGGDQSMPRGAPFNTNGPYGTFYFNSFLNQVANMSK